MTKETNDATTTIVLAPSKELEKFDALYRTTGDNMREMCRLAYTIVNDDKERRKLFTEHVIELGMSRQTASCLLIAGRIYNAQPELLEMSHTNVVELRYVTSDVTGELNEDFYEKTNTDADKLVKMTQRKLRDVVKRYLNDGDETDDSDETDTDETGDATDDTEKEEKKIDITPILNALTMSVTTLDLIGERYKDDFEKEVNKLIHDTLYEVRRAIKTFTDTTTGTEKEK